MCIAIFVQRGRRLPIEQVRTAVANNKDGFGYAFIKGDKVMVYKVDKYTDAVEEQFLKDVRRYGDKSSFLVHARIATHGEVCQMNSHPFLMADGGAVIHNGVVPLPIPVGQSDTGYFVEHILDKLPRGWQNDDTWVAAVDKMIGPGSKMAFIWPDHTYLIVGEARGDWDDRAKRDIWYSNNSYKWGKAVTSPSPTQGGTPGSTKVGTPSGSQPHQSRYAPNRPVNSNWPPTIVGGSERATIPAAGNVSNIVDKRRQWEREFEQELAELDRAASHVIDPIKCKICKRPESSAYHPKVEGLHPNYKGATHDFVPNVPDDIESEMDDVCLSCGEDLTTFFGRHGHGDVCDGTSSRFAREHGLTRQLALPPPRTEPNPPTQSTRPIGRSAVEHMTVEEISRRRRGLGWTQTVPYPNV